jgi:hypothetical protein
VEEKSATRPQSSLNGAQPSAPSTKSERAEADCVAPMGRGATATLERLAASLGQLDEAAPRFASALDIPKGGVLLALLALLVSGLFRHSAKYFHTRLGHQPRDVRGGALR